MDTAVTVERTRKLGRKFGWSARSVIRKAPRIRMLHGDSHHAKEFMAVCSEPCYVEPEFGYVVTDGGELIEESLSPNFDHPKRPWRVGTLPPLRLVADARAQRDGLHVLHLERVISLRHLWEWNYYHFFIDVLGKLEMFDGLLDEPDTPIVLGRYARELPFVMDALQMGRLAERRWIIPDAENRLVVRANEVVFGRTLRPYRQRVDHIVSCLGLEQRSVRADGRIYLTRRPPTGRRLSNESALLPTLNRYGFTVVDAAQIPLREQIEIFGAARHVVAVHGAGVTNIIFRRPQEMSVLELHGSRHPGPGDMARLCAELGYAHSSLGGPQEGGSPAAANFSVDEGEFERALKQMLAT